MAWLYYKGFMRVWGGRRRQVTRCCFRHLSSSILHCTYLELPFLRMELLASARMLETNSPAHDLLAFHPVSKLQASPAGWCASETFRHRHVKKKEPNGPETNEQNHFATVSGAV